MCGIAGMYDRAGGLMADQLKVSLDNMSHRGPDATGIKAFDKCVLGHLRLSIIDLSTGANQPMISHNGRYTMVFNGEVYNFKELRKELGIDMKTESDSEVILEAFSKWGDDFATRLNGMFAIAIWDSEEEELILVRDRLGIKPIYYFEDGGRFLFSSEVKGLVNHPMIKGKLSLCPDAVGNFLYLGYIAGNLTIYQEVKKMEPGTVVRLGKNGKTSKTYWRLEDQWKGNFITDEAEAKKGLKSLLEDAVSKRLVADVPFGTLLSGGIDSSLVTALAQQTYGGKIKTFSIGFEESKFNESSYSRQVADTLGTDHTEFILTEKDATDMVDQALAAYDEPFADVSSIPTMLVFQLAGQHVTMTLSGDGGDELYHGYGFYNWANRLQKPLFKYGRSFLRLGLSFGPDRYRRVSKLLDYSSRDDLKAQIFSQEEICFTKREVGQICDLNWHLATQGLTKEVSHAADNQAVWDIKNYLRDDLLKKVDIASMHSSVENRVPILDHRMVEYAMNIDASLKIKNGEAKYLLKQVLYDYLPKELFDRPKWGFGSPVGVWLKGALKGELEDLLSESSLNEVPFLDTMEIRQLLFQFYNSNGSFIYHRVWLIYVFMKWWRNHRHEIHY